MKNFHDRVVWIQIRSRKMHGSGKYQTGSETLTVHIWKQNNCNLVWCHVQNLKAQDFRILNVYFTSKAYLRKWLFYPTQMTRQLSENWLTPGAWSPLVVTYPWSLVPIGGHLPLGPGPRWWSGRISGALAWGNGGGTGSASLSTSWKEGWDSWDFQLKSICSFDH